MSQTAPSETATSAALRLALEQAPVQDGAGERRVAPRKRATARPAAPTVIDLTAAEPAGLPLDAVLANLVEGAVERGLQAHLPGLLDKGLVVALAPLSGEVATAFADVEFSVQRTTVLETRATVAEARAAAAEHRAGTAEDRLDGTRARAALLEDQVMALKAQVTGLQAQVGELTARPTGLFHRRRR